MLDDWLHFFWKVPSLLVGNDKFTFYSKLSNVVIGTAAIRDNGNGAVFLISLKFKERVARSGCERPGLTVKQRRCAESVRKYGRADVIS